MDGQLLSFTQSSFHSPSHSFSYNSLESNYLSAFYPDTFLRYEAYIKNNITKHDSLLIINELGKIPYKDSYLDELKKRDPNFEKKKYLLQSSGLAKDLIESAKIDDRYDADLKRITYDSLSFFKIYEENLSDLNYTMHHINYWNYNLSPIKFLATNDSYYSTDFCCYLEREKNMVNEINELNIDKETFIEIKSNYSFLKRNDTVFIEHTNENFKYNNSNLYGKPILFPVFSLNKKDTLPFFYDYLEEKYMDRYGESTIDKLLFHGTNYFPFYYKFKLGDYHDGVLYAEKDTSKKSKYSVTIYDFNNGFNFYDTTYFNSNNTLSSNKFDFKKVFNVKDRSPLTKKGVYYLFSSIVYQKDTVIYANGKKIKSHLFHLIPNNYGSKYILNGKLCIDTKFYMPVYTYFNVYELNNEENTQLASDPSYEELIVDSTVNNYFRTLIIKNTIEKIEELKGKDKANYPLCKDLADEFLQYPRIISKPK